MNTDVFNLQDPQPEVRSEYFNNGGAHRFSRSSIPRCCSFFPINVIETDQFEKQATRFKMVLRQKWTALIANLAAAQLAACTPTGDLPSYPPETETTPPKLGAVASESSICSTIGTQLLRDGGNAADALVGTVFCIGVIAMYHSGIGGGGFMIVRSSDGQYEFIDFRETAPAAATEDMYTNATDLSLYGGLAR